MAASPPWSSWLPWWPGRRIPAAAQGTDPAPDTAPAPAPRTTAARWVVADVESSGLDARHDRLLAIAAVAVHFDESTGKPRIDLGDSFEVFLQQPPEVAQQVDKTNILVHHIGMGAQLAGQPPAQALRAWLDYLGDSPLVAYHSPFDEMMIDRALREHLGLKSRRTWLDLEPLAAVLHEDPRRRALDHWLDLHRIPCLTRHQAAADTLATAELLLVLWPMAARRLPRPTHAQLVDTAAAHRFLPGRQGVR